MFLIDAYIVDMKNSVLDDGGAEELRRKYESLKLKLSKVGKEKKEKAQILIDDAEKKYNVSVKEFEENKKKWLKNGRYQFKKELKVDYKDKGRRPYYYTKWVRYVESNGYREAQDRISSGWSFVEAGKDPFWPKMVPMGADGYYHFGGDMVLMKLPLYDYLTREMANRMKSQNASKQAIQSFQERARQQGAGVSEEIVQSVLGT